MPNLYNIGRIHAKIQEPSDKEIENPEINEKTDLKDFLGSLVLMIPSEVVALYFIGRGYAAHSPIINMGIWGLICWLIVVPARFLGMSVVRTKERYGIWTRWVNLLISFISFPVWILALGSPILKFSLDTDTAALIVLITSVIGGWFYTNPSN